MPDPISYLRDALRWGSESLIPKEYVDPLADAIDSPSLDRSPWAARAQGFGAGALEGLRQQFSPINLALAATGTGAARGAMGAGRALGHAVSPAKRGLVGRSIDILEDAPPLKQIEPGAGAVDDLIGELQGNLSRIPNRGGAMPVRPTPAPRPSAGMRDPSMTAVGDEAVFNSGGRMAAGGARPGFTDTLHQERLRRLGGRGR